MKLGIFAKTYMDHESVDSIFSTIAQHQIPGVHYNMVCSGLTELPLDISKEQSVEVWTKAAQYRFCLLYTSDAADE